MKEIEPEGYPIQNDYAGPRKRYCQTLDLRDNPGLIAEYRRRHAPDAVWPEILEGIREVGILEMEIYILGTRLFMIVETPADFDWTRAMERLASLPRQAEWERFMSTLQDAAADASSDEKWRMMQRMFYLY